MKKTYFSLHVFPIDESNNSVPVLGFYDSADAENMINALITLVELGIDCTLTCEVWQEPNSNFEEDLVK